MADLAFELEQALHDLIGDAYTLGYRDAVADEREMAEHVPFDTTAMGDGLSNYRGAELPDALDRFLRIARSTPVTHDEDGARK